MVTAEAPVAFGRMISGAAWLASKVRVRKPNTAESAAPPSTAAETPSSVLDWTPRYDDLETIARHALQWEEKLFHERQADQQHAVSA